MAEGFLTGVSSTPLDISSGARALSRTALETRLGEIAASQEQITENKKNVLKALSINALPELARAQRDRYQKEIQDYRQSVIDKFKSSGGKLTLQQETEIQDGFVDMQNRMQQEVNELKQFQDFQKITTNPAARGLYDMNKLDEIAGSTYKSLMEGKGIGDLTAKLAGAIREQNPADYISKYYAKNVAGLNIESLAQQLNKNSYQVTEREVEAEVDRLLDYVQQTDPNMKYVLSDANQRQVAKDALIREATKQMKGSLYERGTGSGGNKFSPYVVNEPIEDIVTATVETQKDSETSIEKIDIPIRVEKSVPMSSVTSFVYDGNKTAVESVEYVPVAADKEAYAKWVKNRRVANANAEEVYYEERKKDALPEYGMLRKEDVGEYDGAVEYKPFAKVGMTKSRNPFDTFEAMMSNVDPKDLTVKFLPFEGALKGAILAKTATRKDAYESTFNTLDSEMQGKSKAPQEVPTLGRQELLKQGYSDRQINEAVKAGKIRLK